jgi:NitT/TauT family transport system ATP-binding protein
MVSHNIEETVLMADRIVVMDKDPGRVVSTLEVALPQPRQRKAPEFQAVVDQVYGTLAGQTQPEHIELGTAPGEPGRTRGLPYIQVNELAALLEHVDELPGDRADVYRLADDLGVDMDPLLRLTETAELLGFATIEKGDMTLTPLGETFSEASILARKEIFASRIRRVPLFRWLTNLLRAAERQRLQSEVIQTALELEFPPEEASRQLETIISWGRYAEILAFDDDNDTLYLEPGSPQAVPAG